MIDDWTAGIDALVFSECVRCASRWYLPHDRCPLCGAPGHRRLVASGGGVIAAVTVTAASSGGDGAPSGICLVDLDDHVRVLGRAAPTVTVGTRVQVRWDDHQPVFVPAEADRPVEPELER